MIKQYERWPLLQRGDGSYYHMDGSGVVVEPSVAIDLRYVASAYPCPCELFTNVTYPATCVQMNGSGEILTLGIEFERFMRDWMSAKT